MSKSNGTLRRLTAVIITLMMLFSLIPATAFADDKTYDDISVSFTMTHGDGFYKAEKTETSMVREEVKVHYFDIAKYGLQSMYYNPDCYSGGSQEPGTPATADGVVTALHVFIYLTEVYMCGVKPEDAGKGYLYENNLMDRYLGITGGSGSTFISNFWGLGYNLNYYVNHIYPLGKAGWGATSDQIKMNDGDEIELHYIALGTAMGASFSYFTKNDSYAYRDEVTKGDKLTLTLKHSRPDYSSYTTNYVNAGVENVFMTAGDVPGKLDPDVKSWDNYGATDENGNITIDTSGLEPGTYYFGTKGWDDTQNGVEVEAAAFRLTVKAGSGSEAENLARITALKEKFDKSLSALMTSFATDRSITDVATARLNTFGLDMTGVTVSLKSSDDTDVIASDGTIKYISSDTPSQWGNNSKNIGCVFTLTCGTSAVDTAQKNAVVGWDVNHYNAKLTAESESITWDLIKGANTSPDELTNKLTLPQILTNSARTAWGKITWESSDPNVISIDPTGYDTILDPKSGTVKQPANDTKVTLTATVRANDSLLNGNIEAVSDFTTITKTFEVTVKGSGQTGPTEEELLNILKKYYTIDLLKDFVTKEDIDPLHVTADIQLPRYTRIKNENGKLVFANREIAVTSDNDAIKVNGYRGAVDRFKDDGDVKLKVSFTRSGITVSQVFELHVDVITNDELDAELAMMEKAKAHYWDGINDGKFADENSVTDNLHAFREMTLDGSGNPVFAYSVDDEKGNGIVPDSYFTDPAEMEAAGYNHFKSSNKAVIAHESLLVTRQDADTQVTVSSLLSSAKYGDLAAKYPDNAKLQKLSKQEVSVTVTVKGKSNSKTALKAGIDAATAFAATVKEGSEPGQYAVGTLAALNEAIASAQGVYDNASASDEEVNDAAAALAAAVREAKAKMNPEEAEVTVIAQDKRNEYTKAYKTVKVSAKASTNAGFYKPEDYINKVTVIDVLCTIHADMYENFVNAPEEYLVMSQNGTISKIFGVKTVSLGYMVNDKYPTYENKPDMGSVANDTPLKTGDKLTVFRYFNEYYADRYLYFGQNEYETDQDGNVTLNLISFYPMADKTPVALKDATVVLRRGAETLAEGRTDESGNVTLKAPAAGEYEATVTKIPKNEIFDDDTFVAPYASVSYKSSKIDIQIKGLHSAQINSGKLYTYENGVKGTEDLLKNIQPEADGYSLMYKASVPAGDYWYEGYGKNGDCNGGIRLVVSADSTVFTIYRAYEIYAQNSNWERDKDYTIGITVTGKDGTVRETAPGVNEDRQSCLFFSGDTVSAVFTPIGDKAAGYVATTVTKSGKQTEINTDIRTYIPEVMEITVKAPAGSKINVGKFSSYWVYDFMKPVSTDETDGITSVFRVPKVESGWGAPSLFLRVQNPNGVTYWDFPEWNESTTVEVTAADLCIGSSDFKKDTVYRYEKNVYDRADIYMNINGKGFLGMGVGDTYELNMFRNWTVIESFMNSKIALPDMHYTVTDVNGNPSDILTVTPDADNSCVAKLKANGEGTAIVHVTYDAMTDKVGQGGTQYSAIWPECTGVFVVHVGSIDSDIKTNMMIDRVDADTTAIDAEHDILFYTGDEGASYTFTPEAGCTVTVNRSTVTDKMTFGGFTADGISTDSETGAVTVSGLKSGRHIIKVTKGDKTTYQVVTARGVSYVVLDSEGKVLGEDAKLRLGDKVTLQFTNLVNPAEKLQGLYNFNASIYYKGENGTMFRSDPGSNYGVYDFSGNPVRQRIEITIPDDWTAATYSLTGAVKMGGFGNTSVGGHRGARYGTGADPNFNAPTVGMVLSRMPEITFNIEQCKWVSFIGSGQDDVSCGTKAPVYPGEELKFTIKKAQYCKYSVEAGGNVLEPDENGMYSISDADVPAEGLNVKVTKTVDIDEINAMIEAAKKAQEAAEAALKEALRNAKKLDRIYGNTRYETSLKVADALRKELGVEKFDAVVLVSGNGYADALSASYLANVKNAPIIMAPETGIDATVNYIKANLRENGKVYIAGGTAVVPETYDEALKAFDVSRLFGNNRYETNIALLRAAGVTNEDILVCSGSSFADALSASAAGKPVLLVGSSLTDEQKEYLGTLESGNYIMIGGSAVVGDGVKQECAVFGNTERIGGSTRYETSKLVADRFFSGDCEKVVLAYSMDYPDGLCAGVLASKRKAPLLLVNNENIVQAKAWASPVNATKCTVIGGPTFISDDAAWGVIGR